MKRLAATGIALWLVFVSETRVDAYLDPGSGSMLVQLLLGGVAGAAVIMKLGWDRFRGMFRSSSTEPRAARGEGAPASERRGAGVGAPRADTPRETKPDE